MPRTYSFERTQLIRRPLAETFAFFAEPANLERITPEFLGFQILTPQPVAMRAGTLIDYKLRLFGMPLGWRTLIDSFEPPFRFSDTQVRGPYRLWHHEHEFSEAPEGTWMVDRVWYQLPLGQLGRLAHGLFVGRTLKRIFDHRYQAIQRLLSPTAAALPETPAGRW
ncbi:MAG TPA: SRPBCC family protein [Pirellulaceae bacterium]|nr:SRPBCC family protein [Pirellulaceae bacterium]